VVAGADLVEPAPVESTATSRAVSHEPRAERVAPKKAAEPIAPAPLPHDQLESIVESAGLQWVETTHQAALEAQPETVPPPRKPRVRKPRSTSGTEPLEQVETGRQK
jgi:ribonuclease E